MIPLFGLDGSLFMICTKQMTNKNNNYKREGRNYTVIKNFIKVSRFGSISSKNFRKGKFFKKQ